MNVIRAKVLGFCMGVRRAVEITEEALLIPCGDRARRQIPAEKSPTASIYTLGPLIHNPQVLASLTERGVKILEEDDLFSNPERDPGSIGPRQRIPVSSPGSFFLECLKNTTVIIRAHGVSPKTEQMLRKKEARLIDATCPRVKANQNEALALAKNGYRIFLAGEKDHAEIKGIYGYITAETSCIIVGNPEEADHAALRELESGGRTGTSSKKTALIGQTTISENEYRSIALAIKKHFPGLEIKNTICRATRDRQDALRELCSKVDAVVIAGGKESANTRRLLSIAQDCDKTAWLVQTASDINASVLPAADQLFTIIGLSAGASTPDSVIDEIEQALKS